METKTELSYTDTARLCMEALMEKYFSGDVGDNVLFMAISDGDKVDCAVAGTGANLINVLCNCCKDNDNVLTLLSKAVHIMVTDKLSGKMSELLKRINDTNGNGEGLQEE